MGTNCPIPPNANFTYKFQTKDQIGSYTYFPSTSMHRAAGGYGAINVYERPKIPIPFPNPEGDFTLLIGDWYKSTSHKVRFPLYFFEASVNDQLSKIFVLFYTLRMVYLCIVVLMLLNSSEFGARGCASNCEVG